MINFCKFTRSVDGKLHCAECNRPMGTYPENPEEWPTRNCVLGVGTELHKLIKKYFRQDVTLGCSCKNRIAQMNKNGIDWCKENISTVSAWMLASAKERKLLNSSIPGFGKIKKMCAKVVCELLIQLAIRRATNKKV